MTSLLEAKSDAFAPAALPGFDDSWKNGKELKEEPVLRTAGEDELPALLSLWTSVLGAEPTVFTGMYHSCTEENRRTFVVECDGKIVSSVQLFLISVRDEVCEPVKVGAIANVSTDPEYRGRGYSTSLLKMCIEEMVKVDCGWSFLFTGIAPFYERLGWRSIHRNYLRMRIGSRCLAETPGDVHMRLHPDLNLLRELSDRGIPTPLSQIRGDLDWSVRIASRLSSRVVVLTADSYAIASTSNGEVNLEEWAMPESSDEIYRDLALAVAQWAIVQNLRQMNVYAPIRAESRQALESLFSHLVEVDVHDAMVRPIRADWPLSRLISLFARHEARFFRLDNF